MDRGCTLLLAVFATVGVSACLAQGEALGGTERQTKLVLPTAGPEVQPELVILPSPTLSGAPSGLRFTPDGRTLVTTTDDDIVLWDLQARSAYWSQMLDAAPGLRFPVSHYGSEIPPWDGRYTFSPERGQPGNGLPPAEEVFRMGSMDALRARSFVSMDGSVAVIGLGRQVVVWETRSRRLVGRWEIEEDDRVALAPDGAIAAVVHGASVSAWDTRQSRELGTWELPETPGSDMGVAFSPDSSLLAIAGLVPGGQGPTVLAVRVVDLGSAQPVVDLRADVQCPPDRNVSLLSVVSHDGTVAALIHLTSPETLLLRGTGDGPAVASALEDQHVIGGGEWLLGNADVPDGQGHTHRLLRLRRAADLSLAREVALPGGSEVFSWSGRYALAQSPTIPAGASRDWFVAMGLEPPKSPEAPLENGAQVYRIDLQTGDRRLLGEFEHSWALALSPDGTRLATPLGVFDLGTGRNLLSLPVSGFRPLCFFAGREDLLVSCRGSGAITAVRRLGGGGRGDALPLGPLHRYIHHDPFLSAWLGPEGLLVLPTGAGNQRRHGVVPAEPDGPARRFAGMPLALGMGAEEYERGRDPAIGLRDDGSVLAAGVGASGPGWMSPQGGDRFVIALWEPNGTSVSVTDRDLEEAGRLHTPGGEAIPTSTVATYNPWRFCLFSPDGRKLIVFQGDCGIVGEEALRANTFDIDTATVTAHCAVGLVPHHGPTRTIRALVPTQFLADGRTLVVSAEGQIVVVDTGSGQRKAAWPDCPPGTPESDLQMLSASADGRWIATTGDQTDYRRSPVGSVYVHALETGEVAAQVPPREGAAPVGASFRSDGARLALTYSDSVTTLWDLAPLDAGGEGRLMATLVDRPDGEWATVTPEGYVTCSPDAERHLAWRLGESVYPFEQFAAKYRRPDLVRRALAGEDISAERGLTGADVPPTAAFLAPEYDATIEGETAKVEVEVAGARPLARVDLLIDGRPIADELAAAAKWEQIEENHGVYTFELPLSKYQRRTRLQAIVHDEEGLQSMPAEVTFTRSGAPPPATVLHALSVGVSTYRNEEWNNLKYADKDAESFAKVAGEGAARKVLLNESATASSVRFALEEMKASVTEDDIVAIFLAGHGTVDAAGNYYMLLHDSDVADLDNTALPWDDFVGALKSIRAKLVMVFADTCHSGSITGQESVNTLIDRLNRKAGVVVFTASRGDEASIEREDWGHGAFTKALLEGFSGEADTYPVDKQVSLAELRDYVTQRVEELTSGRQHPYLPRLEEFDPARPIANVLPDLK